MTYVLVRYVPADAWMLPGVWQVIFSLGVFSSCRFLPRPMLAAGVWYLMTGAVLRFAGRCTRVFAVGDGRFLTAWDSCWWREFCCADRGKGRGRREMKVRRGGARGVLRTKGWTG